MINGSITATSPIRLITADDHTMVRTGLQMMLELKFGITDILEASSCAEVLTVLRQSKPTHLIIDMVFRDGNFIEIMPTIKGLFPKLNIMVYSMLPTEVYLPALQKFGLKYYLNKETPQDKILSLLHDFLYRPVQIAQDDEDLNATTENPFTALSTRELEVLHYLLKGESVGFAATTLNLHKNTVSTLKARIFEKTGVKNIKGLLDIAAFHNYNG